jgi:hypothetical protein
MNDMMFPSAAFIEEPLPIYDSVIVENLQEGNNEIGEPER